MQYALMIATREDSYQKEFPQIPQSSPEQRRQLAELVGELVESGVLVQTIALGHPDDSRIVRVRDGHTTVSDTAPAPGDAAAAGAREIPAGIFVVDVADEAAALALAARFPGAANAHVLVRPIVPVTVEQLTRAAAAV